MMTSLASNKGNPVHHFLEGKLSDFLSLRAMESELDDWMTEKGEKGRHLIVIQFKRGTWFISHIYIRYFIYKIRYIYIIYIYITYIHIYTLFLNVYTRC
jgi:hypothetical protein